MNLYRLLRRPVLSLRIAHRLPVWNALAAPGKVSVMWSGLTPNLYVEKVRMQTVAMIQAEFAAMAGR
jgi:hypothetical protein